MASDETFRKCDASGIKFYPLVAKGQVGNVMVPKAPCSSLSKFRRICAQDLASDDIRHAQLLH
jgi:hypothetical protein